MNPRMFFGIGLLSIICAQAMAAVIGTNVRSFPVTLERIEQLPAGERAAWKDYLDRSQRQHQAEQIAFRDELKKHAVKEIVSAPAGRGARGLPLNRTNDWYATVEARRLADIILSFQTPAGGWSKNLDMTKQARVPGEHYAANNRSIHLREGDFDDSAAEGWDYVGTFDNDATTTQMQFLARVIHAGGDRKYRDAFARGLDYVHNSQYPNGGWPQVWPLAGGYHDAVTFNDGAMMRVLELMQDVAEGRAPFDFVTGEQKQRAAAAVSRGVKAVLASQIVTNGTRTVWGQQHDAITLRPCSARNFEMPSASSSESAGVLAFLMRLKSADTNIVSAINAAGAWFEKTQLRDVAYRSVGDQGPLLVPAPGNGPIWSRYYEIGTDRPIFGERDKTIHDVVEEISRERRTGYAWYTDAPAGVLRVWVSRRESK